ncbi:MAG: hypothetical protein HY072_03760 [Deltaproteobacteria bacterium]|nr:hypothetical protein [Deltaproteobacteria bacterium]
MKFIRSVMVVSVVLCSICFADHNTGGEIPGYSQIYQELSQLLIPHRFDGSKISKITELAVWAIRDTSQGTLAEKNINWFRFTLHQAFSYDFKNKVFSENPKVTLEDKVNLVIANYINQTSELPPPPFPGGGQITVSGAFVFYHHGSWPPPYPPYPTPYPPAPSWTKRSFDFSGYGFDSIYQQCLDYVYEHRIDYIVAIEFRHPYGGYPGTNWGMKTIPTEQACYTIASRAY